MSDFDRAFQNRGGAEVAQLFPGGGCATSQFKEGPFLAGLRHCATWWRKKCRTDFAPLRHLRHPPLGVAAVAQLVARTEKGGGLPPGPGEGSTPSFGERAKFYVQSFARSLSEVRP